MKCNRVNISIFNNINKKKIKICIEKSNKDILYLGAISGVTHTHAHCTVQRLTVRTYMNKVRAYDEKIDF